MLNKIDIKDGVPVMSWCGEIDDNTMDQITNLTKHPCTVNNVAILPDCHLGFGMPIGGVAALDNAISPAMIGFDIGCGMMAVKTNINGLSTGMLKVLKEKIKQRIPTGFSKRSRMANHNFPIDTCFGALSEYSSTFSKNYKKEIEKSIGTLGGGNHFIEVQKGSDGFIWIMIHSGSRNFGKTIAEHWNQIAMSYNESFHTERNAIAKDLAFLPTTGPCVDGHEYIVAMKYALDYAKENRRVMMKDVKDAIMEMFDIPLPIIGIDCEKEVEFSFELDVHHNYASLEHHFGKNVWIHRKGATSARAGQLGIIPGSMGTNSYIVEGLGNPMSFNSCSHGSGRNYSRTKATLELDMEKENEIMKDVVFDGFSKIKRGNKKIRGKFDLGEAPSSYKDIHEVMENQKDLVSIFVELTPLMVIKG